MEPEIPAQSNFEKLVGLDSSEADEADDSPYSRPEKELPDTTQEVECATTSEDLKVANIEIRQLPEECDLGALGAYIEEPLRKPETDEGDELSSKELDFDVDDGLVGVNTFVEEEHPWQCPIQLRCNTEDSMVTQMME